MAKKAAKGAAAKKKRTVSGRRGKPGRKNNQGTDTRGVVGIVVFCIGFLALLCQFIPSDGGATAYVNRLIEADRRKHADVYRQMKSLRPDA